jgi:hypothetical protein
MQSALQVWLIDVYLLLVSDARPSRLDFLVNVIQTRELWDVLQYQVELNASPIILYIPQSFHELVRQCRPVLEQLIICHMRSGVGNDHWCSVYLSILESHSRYVASICYQLINLAIHSNIHSSLCG